MIKNMKLVFNKNENKGDVKISRNDNTEDFSYVNMLKYLLDGDELEDSRFNGSFSDEEKNAVNEMIEKINEAINKEDEPKEEKISSLSDNEEDISIKNIPF
jgi:hypothetical protein